MAAITKRGKRWFAQVRRKGHPAQRRTFTLKADAEAWSRRIESEFDRGLVADITSSSRTLMSDLFKRYQREATPAKKNARSETYMFRRLEQHFGHLALANVSVAQVSEFREKLSAAGLAPSTVRNYMQLLSAVMQKAISDWGYYAANVVHSTGKPKVQNERNRRLSKEEEERLMAEAGSSSNEQLLSIIVLAIESAMRLGELLEMNWSDIDWKRRYVHVPITKNSDPRDVPLSLMAIEALKSIPKLDEGRVFSKWARSDSFNKGWRSLLRRAGIKNLRFHDLRHEAASRMTERGLSPLEVARITGHRSMQMLKRYSHFSIQHLVGLIDAGRKPTFDDE